MEEFESVEFEIVDDHSAYDSHQQGIEAFLMTSEEIERSASPGARRGGEEEH